MSTHRQFFLVEKYACGPIIAIIETRERPCVPEYTEKDRSKKEFGEIFTSFFIAFEKIRYL